MTQRQEQWLVNCKAPRRKSRKTESEEERDDVPSHVSQKHFSG